MAIEWLVEWPRIATMIEANLPNAMGRSGRRARAGAGARGVTVHPGIVSTHSTWTEWIGRVRTEYATRFGMVRRGVLDEDGRPRTAWVPCDDACPPARTDAEEVRYETCVLDLIEEVDARSGYELAQWRQLGEAATSRSQRVVVEFMLGAYRNPRRRGARGLGVRARGGAARGVRPALVR